MRAAVVLLCACALALVGCGDTTATGSRNLLNFSPVPEASPTPSAAASSVPPQPAATRTVVVTQASALPRKSTAPQATAPPPAYGIWITSRGFTSDGSLQSQNPILHIPAGGRVRFFNKDTVRHTFTANEGLWDSGQVAPGASWDYVATRTGDFDFHDNDVPSFYGQLQVG